MLGTTVNVYPFGRIFGSLKADGLYYAELPEGESVDEFMNALQLNIEKETGIKIDPTDLKGDVSNVGMPTRDLTNYVLVFTIFIILFIFYTIIKKSVNPHLKWAHNIICYRSCILGYRSCIEGLKK